MHARVGSCVTPKALCHRIWCEARRPHVYENGLCSVAQRAHIVDRVGGLHCAASACGERDAAGITWPTTSRDVPGLNITPAHENIQRYSLLLKTISSISCRVDARDAAHDAADAYLRGDGGVRARPPPQSDAVARGASPPLADNVWGGTITFV